MQNCVLAHFFFLLHMTTTAARSCPSISADVNEGHPAGHLHQVHLWPRVDGRGGARHRGEGHHLG